MAMNRTAVKASIKAPRPVKQDLLVITPELVATWEAPPFQRPVRENAALHEVVEQLRSDGGVFSGTPFQLGIWEGTTYLIDGQHRRKAFLLSGLPEALIRVEITTYEDGVTGLEAMSRDYINISTNIVAQRPDDKLRAFESFNPALQHVRSECPFVGYDGIRRNSNAPVLSMSTTIKCWLGSANEIPTSSNGAMENARNLTLDDARMLAQFLNLAFKAWGREPENNRLWGSLNLSLCMWLYRRIVNNSYSVRVVRLDDDLFVKCLLSVAATASYIDWLVGRNTTERDRSPAYNRLKAIFVKRIKEEVGKAVSMPSPPWASSGGGHK